MYAAAALNRTKDDSFSLQSAVIFCAFVNRLSLPRDIGRIALCFLEKAVPPHTRRAPRLLRMGICASEATPPHAEASSATTCVMRIHVVARRRPARRLVPSTTPGWDLKPSCRLRRPSPRASRCVWRAHCAPRTAHRTPPARLSCILHFVVRVRVRAVNSQLYTEIKDLSLIHI